MKIEKLHKYYNTKWFSRMAPIYDYVEFFILGLRKNVAGRVNKANAKILDVACGTGNQSIAFARNGFSVIGIDLSPHMLKYAKKKIKQKYDLDFICVDATKIPYKKSKFDISSISFGLHDMPEQIGIRILKEMKRVTKNNGKLIIVDYNKPKNKFIAFLGYKIAKIWETRYYDHFVKVGLESYLNKVNLKCKSKETFLLGNIQIVECLNKK